MKYNIKDAINQSYLTNVEKSYIKINRFKGNVMGALLWLPSHIIEPLISPEQEELEVLFKDNHIKIENGKVNMNQKRRNI